MQGWHLSRGAALCALLAACMAPAASKAGTLTIEGWRGDDKGVWENVLIPAFQKQHPGVKVIFSPTAPTEYDSSLNARLAGGTAGDLLACRPFDVSLSLYRQGRIDRLDGKDGMENFPPSAKVAWQTDDGKETFCMPVASVIHGFFYNKAIFRELGLLPPKTEDAFFNVLETVKRSGKYAPLALGTADQWEAHQLLFTSIGPNYWKGEEGRKALIKGTARFTDAPFVAAWDYAARIGAYLHKGASAQTYGDSQNQFSLGRAAIYPGGSWDTTFFSQNPQMELGVFPPPVRSVGDQCYLSDHTDIGMAVNAGSKNKADAYLLLAWMGSQEFADLYTNEVTGFFSLSRHPITVKNPIARQMLEWRTSCASTIRLNAQVMNRGYPSMENEMWVVNARVLNGKLSASDAAEQIQSGFAKWYPPQQQADKPTSE
jgi:raffinose/stachyose/melibiose transport system substrate-binding protein